jgi:hypothetical protein
VVGPFLDGLDEALTSAGISIVHLKVFDSSPEGWLKAAVCANGEEPKVEGNLDASAAHGHELLVNLRAKGEPEQVRKLVERSVAAAAGRGARCAARMLQSGCAQAGAESAQAGPPPSHTSPPSADRINWPEKNR